MKRSSIKSRIAKRLLAVTIVGAFLSSNAVWGQVIVPPAGLVPLNQVLVPTPPTLSTFVKNKPAAIKLGKALFWDMQVGSDGVQACGTCHFTAGFADTRMKNQLNPNTLAAAPDSLFGNNFLGVPGFPFGVNYTLTAADFPLHQRLNPESQTAPITRDTNDVVSSQGVRLSTFSGVVFGSAVDSVLTFDPVFNLNGQNTRRVEPRNAPTVVNAVFNFTNFWDGRANMIFNGVDPFGPLDQDARIWVNIGTPAFPNVVQQQIAMEFASLASQAVGPPLSNFEMSGQGRIFPDIGKKMINNGLIPLGKQLVHPTDSVLGPLTNAVIQPDGTIAGGRGLNTTYKQMIMDAFADNLWNGGSVVVIPPDAPFDQMEANFSLFFGLAVMLYESTLISDQTPFDAWVGGNANALTQDQKLGFNIFSGVGNCELCHLGATFTSASVENIAFVNNRINATQEVMFVADGAQVVYDEGFNNTGVTQINNDLGRGGTAPFVNPLTGQNYPLSFSRLAELQAQAPSQLPFGDLTTPGTPVQPLALDVFPNNVRISFRVNDRGSFKVPGLRNVELSAPYFHNGSAFTLDQVVDFYSRGGNFPAANIAELDPLIPQSNTSAPLHDPVQQAQLVSFMKALTDPRVVAESAPFDHPEIFIPEGEPEVLTQIPARSASGAIAPTPVLILNPVVTPTNANTQTLSGTMQAGLTPSVSVNGGAPVSAVVSGTGWSASIGGLTEGTNNVVVSVATPTIITVPSVITLDTIAPALTIDPVAPSRLSTQNFSGTVEAGIRPTITVSPAGVAGAVNLPGPGVWSAQVSGLRSGTTTIAITATDAARNATTKTVTVLLPDGSFSGGAISVLDALKALQFAVGSKTPTLLDLQHGDVAPLGSGDGVIDVADALLILKKGIGLVSF